MQAGTCNQTRAHILGTTPFVWREPTLLLVWRLISYSTYPFLNEGAVDAGPITRSTTRLQLSENQSLSFVLAVSHTVFNYRRLTYEAHGPSNGVTQCVLQRN